MKPAAARAIIDAYKTGCAQTDVVSLRLSSRNGSSLSLVWDERIIDAHQGIDIATFSITEDEVVGSLGHVVLTGYQKSWPPNPPCKDRGIYYCGYPVGGTIQTSPYSVCFGVVCGSGVASSISEFDISTLIDIKYLIPGLGDGIPPGNFNFSGMSGGPMIRVTEGVLRGWELAGVLYTGPNTSTNHDEAICGLEIIKARRADFIQTDGTLDVKRWNLLNL